MAKRNVTQDKFEKEMDAMARETQMKEIEVKVLNNKMKAVKEENIAIRMQLKDPSVIKRHQPQDMPGSMYASGNEGGPLSDGLLNFGNEMIPEFDRVQKNYDMLGLQEELKQMIIENSLLKKKIFDMSEKFKKIEDSRETYINNL